jgi:MoaA/NifB/PqqE/SkfB family radical SAM enzyme
MNNFNNEITCYVLTTENNPNFEDCLEALKRQTIQFKIDIIKNYYPISRAFQEMFNRAKTKYVCQIDEDMILYPHAIQTLYNSLNNADSKVFMSCYELHDTHLNFDMFGVKIFNTEICKKVPLPQGTFSGSLVQIAKLQIMGYTYLAQNEALGLHSPKWTNRQIFSRYFDLMDKYKAKGYEWMGELPSKLYKMYQQEPNEINFYALIGSLTNMMLNNKIPIEKDNSKENEYYISLTKLLSIEKSKIDIKINPPTSATLSMTTKCNLKCNFCLRQSNQIESAPDMTVEKIEELLKIFPSIKSFCLCGFGEPLLNNNLENILKYIKENNLGSGIITNGAYLKNKIEILKKYTPGYISVSLNAPNQELHKKVCNVDGLFNTILEGIKLCVKNNLKIYLTYVCDKNTIAYVPEFLKLAKSLKVDGVHLFNILPHHLLTNQTQEDFLKLVLTDKDKNITETWKKLPESDIILNYPVLINPNYPQRQCRFAWQKLTINGNGSISICNSIFPPEKNNGNINDTDIWENHYCQNFRNNLYKGIIPMACQYCFRNFSEE